MDFFLYISVAGILGGLGEAVLDYLNHEDWKESGVKGIIAGIIVGVVAYIFVKLRISA